MFLNYLNSVNSIAFQNNVLGPHYLLKTYGTIHNQGVTILFDCGGTHNFLDSNMVPILRIKTTKRDHDYKVLTGGGHVQRHSLIAHGVPLVINNYIEKLTFHVMCLRTVS